MKTLTITNSSTQRFFNPLLNVTVFENLISEETRKAISEYSKHLFETNKMSKNPTSEGRYRKRINDQDAECVNNIIKELDNYFKQYNGVPDTNIGNILTYNFDESNVQPHQDDYDAIQLRINIMIEKDDSGNPVINGFLYKITQSGGWAFSPSSAMHGSTKVKTAIRINLSMGWNFKNTEDYNNAFISLSS